MANYAHVENNEIKGVYDQLPRNWKNISGFNKLIDYPEELESHGWKVIQKKETQFDPLEYRLVSIKHYIENNVVYEEQVLEKISKVYTNPELTEEEKNFIKEEAEKRAILIEWDNIRSRRDQLMQDIEWRYNRYYRNERLGIEQVDDISILDNYMNDLANITNQPDPFSITWPELSI